MHDTSESRRVTFCENQTSHKNRQEVDNVLPAMNRLLLSAHPLFYISSYLYYLTTLYFHYPQDHLYYILSLPMTYKLIQTSNCEIQQRYIRCAVLQALHTLLITRPDARTITTYLCVL